MRNATGAATEVALAIGKLWLHLASLGTDLYAARVESKANIADGPTREDLSLLAELGATFFQPVLLSWVYEIWDLPSLSES